MSEQAERAVIEQALARGYLTQEQVRAAQHAAAEQRRAGRPATLLDALRRALRPEHAQALGAVWRAALAPSASRSSGAQPAQPVPDDSATLDERSPVGAPAPAPVAGPDPRMRVVAAWREALAHDPDFDPVTEVRLEQVEELGRGGMGVVNRVRDARLGRDAALKLMLGAGDEAAVSASCARCASRRSSTTPRSRRSTPRARRRAATTTCS